MKRILILGAGLVSRPGVSYLLKSNDLQVTVASRTVSKAEKLVEGSKNGKAVELDVNDEAKLEKLIRENDIIVSLLPWIHHVKVAELSLKNSKNMATTSYVSEGMKNLDEEVKRKNLLFLNEIGVDPGIDHMSAMKIIDEVHAEGGKIVDFYSYCGGLPAPEDNDNPFGYKFSWSPKGVVLASRNSAKYLEHGKVVNIEGKDLFLNSRKEHVDQLGEFEVYPNRDSIPYISLYGITEAKTVMRGTYRNLGWCETLKKIVDLDLVDDKYVGGLANKSYRNAIAKLSGFEADDRLEQNVAKKLGVSIDSNVIKRLTWLGLFSEEIVPKADNYLDMLSDLLQEKLYYKQNERDMLLLQHKFLVENSDGSRDMITSTMIDFGIKGGDSSMARTVSLPLAIGVKFMAEGKFNVKGVRIPNIKDIYEPVLSELETLGIKMIEKRTPFSKV